MSNIAFKPKKRLLKLSIIILSIVLIFPIIFNFVIDIHPQLLIGLFQGYQNQNSFEPRYNAKPGITIKENGIIYMNDIKYADEYPNSYIDISYPNEFINESRPTFIYIHGGGFFGGDKIIGDPLAVNNDYNYLFDSIVLEGYNLINMNYALVPQYRFPTPEIQLNQLIKFLKENSDKYHLDMTNVIIMGQSAGAIMTAQYGAIISNSEYAKLYNITPELNTNDIKCLIIDDAPLVFDSFDRNGKRLIGNFISGHSFPSNKKKDMYNPIGYINENYPTSFIIGNNYNDNGYAHDMEQLFNKIKSLGIKCEFFYDKYEDGTEPGHGYFSNLKNDKLAQKCYESMIKFLKSI